MNTATAENKIMYTTSAHDFSKIPGSPIAYWVSRKFLAGFEYSVLGEVADCRSGMSTTDNERFLRYWHEVAHDRIGFGYISTEETKGSRHKWYPYNKGGERRKWFGNRFLVVNWENDGYDIKHWVVNNPKDPNTKSWSRRLFNIEYSFREGLTWTALSSNGFNIRHSEQGFMFDSKGASCFCKENNEDDIYYICGLLNSTVSQSYLDVLCPTLDYGVGQVARVPLRRTTADNMKLIKGYVSSSIEISKSEWNAFETSWDFKKHPLI